MTHSERDLIRAAGCLPTGTTNVEAFVVQSWSGVNECWLDGSSESYATEAEAVEREAEISGWAHVGRTRIVHRVIRVSEQVRE